MLFCQRKNVFFFPNKWKWSRCANSSRTHRRLLSNTPLSSWFKWGLGPASTRIGQIHGLFYPGAWRQRANIHATFRSSCSMRRRLFRRCSLHLQWSVGPGKVRDLRSQTRAWHRCSSWPSEESAWRHVTQEPSTKRCPFFFSGCCGAAARRHAAAAAPLSSYRCLHGQQTRGDPITREMTKLLLGWLHVFAGCGHRCTQKKVFRAASGPLVGAGELWLTEVGITWGQRDPAFFLRGLCGSQLHPPVMPHQHAGHRRHVASHVHQMLAACGEEQNLCARRTTEFAFGRTREAKLCTPTADSLGVCVAFAWACVSVCKNKMKWKEREAERLLPAHCPPDEAGRDARTDGGGFFVSCVTAEPSKGFYEQRETRVCVWNPLTDYQRDCWKLWLKADSKTWKDLKWTWRSDRL